MPETYRPTVATRGPSSELPESARAARRRYALASLLREFCSHTAANQAVLYGQPNGRCRGWTVRLIRRLLTLGATGLLSAGLVTGTLAGPSWAAGPATAAPADATAVNSPQKKVSAAAPSPIAIRGVPGDQAVILWWVPPRVPRTATITDYLIQYSANGGGSWKGVSDGVSANPSATVSGLRNGKGYRFRVATVSRSTSGYSTPSPQIAPRQIDCQRPGPGANLAGCDLDGVTRIDLSGANLQSSLLRGASPSRLVGSYLENASLTTADLRGLDMRGSNLSRAGLLETDLGNANLKGISARNSYFNRTVLHATNVSDADLSDATFTGNVGYTGGVSFARSILTRCSFSSAEISGVDFTDADLSSCSFRNSQVGRVTWTPAPPYGMRLNGADLTEADFGGWMSDLDLQGADLSRANLTGFGTQGRSYGRPKALPHLWQLRSGFLLGPTVRVQHADLSGMNLRGINLTDGQLQYVDLDGTDMRRTTLTRIQSQNLTGSPLLPGGWALIEGSLTQQ